MRENDFPIPRSWDFGLESSYLDRLDCIELHFMLRHLPGESFANTGIDRIEKKVTGLLNLVCLISEDNLLSFDDKGEKKHVLYQHVAKTVLPIRDRIRQHRIEIESSATRKKLLLRVKRESLEKRGWSPDSVRLLQTFSREVAAYMIDLAVKLSRDRGQDVEIGKEIADEAFGLFIKQIRSERRPSSGYLEMLNAGFRRHIYLYYSAFLSAGLGTFFAGLPGFSWPWFLICIAAMCWIGLSSPDKDQYNGDE